MAGRWHILALGALAICISSGAGLAHHSWPVNRARQVTLNGTVTGYDWVSPHVMIGLDVRRDGGTVEKWRVGGPSPGRMSRNGWDRNTLKPGEEITAIGYRFRDGSNVLRLDKIVRANGQEMLLYGRR